MARRTQEEEKEVRAAGFAWDLALQLVSLREQRGLSQAELAELVGTKQQAISRLENPGYDRQSLTKLREIANALESYVDVVLVPWEKAEPYIDCRYQPVLDEDPPCSLHTDGCQLQFQVGQPAEIRFDDNWEFGFTPPRQPSAPARWRDDEETPASDTDDWIEDRAA